MYLNAILGPYGEDEYMDFLTFVLEYEDTSNVAISVIESSSSMGSQVTSLSICFIPGRHVTL